MAVRYLPRSEWGGGPLRRGVRASIRGLVSHHTVFGRGGKYTVTQAILYMRQLQTIRPDLGNEVPYSFVVFTGMNGGVIVAEGRGFNWSGAHTVGYNSSRYGVAKPGNTNLYTPSAEQIEGINWIGARLSDPVGAARTLGHRDVAATNCPGNGMYARLHLVQPPFRGVPTAPRPTPPPPPTTAKAWWFRMATAAEKRELENSVRKVLDEGTARGLKGWAATNEYLVHIARGLHNQVNAIRARVDRIEIHVTQIRRNMAGYTLVAPQDWRPGEPVYWTDFKSKTALEHEGPLHLQLRAILRLVGRSTNAVRLDRAVIDQIPTTN